MTIGLPKAMLYYRYKNLWETFFGELGCETVTSRETDKKILSDGIRFSADENCLPSKIYMGHVYSLIGKCDRILVPRVVSYGRGNDVCVKFNALYDIVRNTFADADIIGYNIDVPSGCYERKGFAEMGKVLGFGAVKTFAAYAKAKKAQSEDDVRRASEQEKALAGAGGPKILIVSHPYNAYDRLTGYPISRYIRSLGGIPVYADAADHAECAARAKDISGSLYWLYSKELIGSLGLLSDAGRIDGVILLTAFPCGPDSLVNELIIRKFKKVPVINIVLDDLQSETGLQTRIESFFDLLCPTVTV